jgi:hypothetical protein
VKLKIYFLAQLFNKRLKTTLHNIISILKKIIFLFIFVEKKASDEFLENKNSEKRIVNVNG